MTTTAPTPEMTPIPVTTPPTPEMTLAPVPQAPHAVETATAATLPWLEELQAIRATLADALAG